MAKKEGNKTETPEAVEEKKYVAVKTFTDLQDSNHVYKEGHVYPRDNKKADQKRVAELSSNKNRRKEAVIKVKGE